MLTPRSSIVSLAFAVICTVSSGAVEKRPNLIFIMTDQHRFDCLGANGNSIIKTPNLDRLAARSANFQKAFVQAPVCVPSRVTWFTGRYPHSHRNRVNYTPLPRSELLLQRLLKNAGYTTAVVGKLHLHPPTADEARRTGFDRVLLHDGVGWLDRHSDYARWRQENDPRREVRYRAYARDVPPGKNPFRAAIADEFTDTSWIGSKSRELLADLLRGEEPFFLFVSFWKPHSPFEVPAPFDSMYDDVEIPLPDRVTLDDIRRLPPPLQKLILRSGPRYDMDRERLQWMYRSYYAAISHIDREVGRLLDLLEESGRAGETIVVFSSDHGDQLLEHGVVGKNVFFEASVRIPFLFSFPGRVRPGKYEELIETTDFVPTICELTGIETPRHAQGRSFVPLVGPAPTGYRPREVVFCENIIPEVITSGRLDFRFEKGKGVGGVRHPDAKMVRSKRWKLNYYPEGYLELYDLVHDPREKRNLAGEARYQGVVNEMKERLLHWMVTADETEQIAEEWLFPEGSKR